MPPYSNKLNSQSPSPQANQNRVNYQKNMNPYLDGEIKYHSRQQKSFYNESAVSYDSGVVTPKGMSRLRAATMMKHTKATNPLTTKAADGKGSTIFNTHARKASVDVHKQVGQASQKIIAGGGNASITHQAVDGLKLAVDQNQFHLPNLGKTVSHSMTPANLRQNNGIELGTDDVKLKELLAK